MAVPGVEDKAQVGVWDENTGKLVWRPPSAVALCWLRDGSEIALVTRSYSGILERRSWPDDELISGSEVAHRDGWVDRVTASRKNDLIAVRWLEQTKAGVELFTVRRDGDRQLKDRRLRTGESNLIEGPVFSPSGWYLVLAEGVHAWWNHAKEESEPSPGGRFPCGRATIFDTHDGLVRHFPIEATVAAGWFPETEKAQLGLLGIPRFLTSRSFVIDLPTGETRRFSTSGKRASGSGAITSGS